MGLGRVYPGDPNEPFCMTVLALKLSRHANGVSALHGEVSRRMWQPLYPDRTEEEVPIGHITNGVHVLSWLAPQMQRALRPPPRPRLARADAPPRDLGAGSRRSTTPSSGRPSRSSRPG